MANKKCNLLCNDTCEYVCGRPKPTQPKEESKAIQPDKCSESIDLENVSNIQNQIKKYFKDEELYREPKPPVNYNNESPKKDCDCPSEDTPKIEKEFHKLNILISNEVEKYTITESNYEIISDDICDYLSNFLKTYKENYIINIDGFDPLMLFHIKTKKIIDFIKTTNSNIPIMITSNLKLLDDEMLSYFKNNDITLCMRIRNNEINNYLIDKINKINEKYFINIIEIDCEKDNNLLENIKKLYSNGINKIELLNLNYENKELESIFYFYLEEKNLNIYTLDHMLYYFLNSDSYNEIKSFEMFLTYDLKLYYTQYQNKIFTNSDNVNNGLCLNCKLYNLCKYNNIILDCNYEKIYEKLINTIEKNH